MIGLEETFDEHLDNLVGVFNEVWRVLRKDGTCWLNYGDAYAAFMGETISERVPGKGEPKDGASSIPRRLMPPPSHFRFKAERPDDDASPCCNGAYSNQAGGYAPKSSGTSPIQCRRA